MINSVDLEVLGSMRREVAAIRSGAQDLASSADRLIALHDALRLHDKEWSNKLSQHLVTLDSASTFTTANRHEARQVRDAVEAAASGIIGLIDQKTG
jgi:hypothetical protein